MARTFTSLHARMARQLPLFLLIALFAGTAHAEAPSVRMMPDGSSDLYAGLAVASRPAYRGSDERKTEATALLQMQWSSGIFVSGASVGMHLSDGPRFEYGPLLALEPGRNASGALKSSVGSGTGSLIANTTRTRQPLFTDISSRPMAGGFFNFYLDENLRLTSSLLYGAGNDRNGMLFNAGLQKRFAGIAPHHSVSASVNATWANREYNREYFGVISMIEPSYLPAGGLRDVQLGLNWNWELSPTWLLSSQLSASRLMGGAADSPLTQRRDNLTVRTGLAYRF